MKAHRKLGRASKSVRYQWRPARLSLLRKQRVRWSGTFRWKAPRIWKPSVLKSDWRGKGSGSRRQSRCYSGGECGRDRRCQWPGCFGRRGAQKAYLCLIRESRRPFGGRRRWSQPMTRLSPCHCSRLGTPLAVNQRSPGRRRVAGPHLGVGSVLEAGRGRRTGVSPKLESWGVLRVPVTIS